MPPNPEGLARARTIKVAREEALRDLPAGRLYIVLYLRTDPPVPNNYHWAFYHHPMSPSPGGLKSHIRNEGSGWMKDQSVVGCIFKEQFLCCLVEIGVIAAEQEERLHSLLDAYDEDINEGGTTCTNAATEGVGESNRGGSAARRC